MKYAFFLDIDGTLVWSHDMPKRNIDIIARARRDGNLVLLNTGRSLKFIPPRVTSAFELDGIVAGSGAYLILNGKVLQACYMSVSQLVSAFEYLSSHDREFVFEGENEVLVYKRPLAHDYWQPLTSATELMPGGKYDGAHIQKVNISGILTKEEHAFLSELFTALQQYDYAECSVKGCDKGAGLWKVMSTLPSDFKSVAMGDSYNDIEMLEAADIAVAMGNAPDSVKQLCDIVTVNADKFGVADAFSEILGYID